MRKTFCDGCGKECVNVTYGLGLGARHHTKKGETVGNDEFSEADLCKDCVELIRRLFPNAFRIIRYDSSSDSMTPMSVAAPADQIAEERRHP